MSRGLFSALFEQRCKRNCLEVFLEHEYPQSLTGDVRDVRIPTMRFFFPMYFADSTESSVHNKDPHQTTKQ